jgi:hypothetical protein
MTVFLVGTAAAIGPESPCGFDLAQSFREKFLVWQNGAAGGKTAAGPRF